MKKLSEMNPQILSIGIAVFGLLLTVLDMIITGDQTGASLTLLGNGGLIVFGIGLFSIPVMMLYNGIKNILAKKK